jgi:hypothetical protein
MSGTIPGGVITSCERDRSGQDPATPATTSDGHGRLRGGPAAERQAYIWVDESSECESPFSGK